jgi:hypothetical protein
VQGCEVRIQGGDNVIVQQVRRVSRALSNMRETCGDDSGVIGGKCTGLGIKRWRRSVVTLVSRRSSNSEANESTLPSPLNSGWQVDKVDDGSVDETASAKVTAGLAVKVPPPCKDYALAMSAFNSDVVGAKSRNTLALQENLGGGKLPSWINLPYSVAVPFGAMERVLDLPDNADAKAELQVRQPSMTLTHAGPQHTVASFCSG